MLRIGSYSKFYALAVLAIWGMIASAAEQNNSNREKIGQVLGQPVYRDQLRVGKNIRVRNELHRLFTHPILQAYREAHREEVSPTDDEIDRVANYFQRKHQQRMREQEAGIRQNIAAIKEKLETSQLTTEQQRKLHGQIQGLEAQLKPPGTAMANVFLQQWKLQRHFYDNYGGGRILWQQGGVEAFDATHRWLQSQEKNGSLQFTDKQLRDTFFEYWTTLNHGAFLTDDRKRIRSAFLEPEWRQN